MFLGFALSFVGTLLQEILYLKHRRSRMKREFKMAENLESRMDEVFYYLMREMETMNRDSTKFQESVWSELQLIREDMEKERGNNEEDIARALESRMEKLLQQQAERYLLLEQELQKSQESTKSELQLIRRFVVEALGKNEDIAKALDSRMEKLLLPIFQRIQNLEGDLQERQDFPKCESQLLRADPDKEQGKKEEEIARALDSRMEKKLKHLFQRIQNLEQDLEKSQEFTQCHLQLLRSDLENKLVMNEEKIAGAYKSVMDEKFDQLFQRIHNLEGDLQKSQESSQYQLPLLRTDLEKN